MVTVKTGILLCPYYIWIYCSWWIHIHTYIHTYICKYTYTHTYIILSHLEFCSFLQSFPPPPDMYYNVHVMVSRLLVGTSLFFFFSIMCVLGIEIRSAGLVARSFTHRSFSLVFSVIYKLRKNNCVCWCLLITLQFGRWNQEHKEFRSSLAI